MYEIHSWFIGTNLGQFLQRGQFYPRSVASVTTLRHLFINYYILYNYLLIIYIIHFSTDFSVSPRRIRTELRKFPVTRTMYNTS